jgi:carboxyl-terminal processing protease
MWTTLKWSLAGLIVVLLVALAGVAGYAINDNSDAGSGDQASSGDYAILDEIQQILGEEFVNPDAVTIDTLRPGAINGMIASLNDAHTTYIPPEVMQNGIDIITGSFEGIGANVNQDPVTREIVIVAPFRDSPAERAGIKAGDVILAVDGESTEGWSLQTAVERIRGPEGTDVTITVRHTDRTEQDITVTRQTVDLPTVFVSDLTDAAGDPVPDLAYIQMQRFTDDTVGDMRDALNQVVQDGKKGLVLDLRGNPGGGLDATVSIADMFLDEGVVLTQVDRDGSRTDYRSEDGGEATNLPVVILVDQYSASGSEVLAGALRDHDRAQLIGTQTLGKGTVNHLRPLSNGGAVYVSIARWLTPDGTLIEGVGLTPDYKMEQTENDAPGGIGPQLFAAIDLLHSQINGTAFVPPATPAPTAEPSVTVAP